MILKAPCYKCGDREIGCHSVCERYLAFAEYRKRINEARFKENEMIGADLWRHEHLNKISRRRERNK